jgi:hypothetical protein
MAKMTDSQLNRWQQMQTSAALALTAALSP